MELINNIIDEAEKIDIKETNRNEKGELLVSPDGKVSNLGKQSEFVSKIKKSALAPIFYYLIKKEKFS